MHQKTETKVKIRWVKPAKPRFSELETGTYFVDADCELFLVGDDSIVNVETGTSLLEQPSDFRVVPKVTFHVELEGEG